jgi:FtsP/CotA-like multicopper oxidase with cupredoxin domain
MKLLKLIALVLVIIVGVTGVTVYTVLTTYYPGLYFPAASQPCPSGANASSNTHFTIVMSNQGFNSSRNSAPCPTVSVMKGQTITIHVVNNDGEKHGFAITHYLDAGIALNPGESRDVTFTVDQTGSFLIYCNVGCFVHNWQQNGRLTVTG